MAGDWLKFEKSTSDKPEVWAIADELAIDPDAVVGKLLRVWAWFDEQSESGNAPSVSKSLLDRRVGVTGFCDAMVLCGWMEDDGREVSLPNFDRHNGKTAKNRSLTAKRVAKHKRKSNAECNAAVTQTPLPREEKRREENKDTKPDTPGGDVEPPVALMPTNKHNTKGEEYPVTQSQIDEWQEVYPAVNCLAEVKQARLWLKANPAKRKTYGGMAKFLNSWMARQQNKGGSSAHGAITQQRPSHMNEMPRPDRPNRR